MATPEWVTCAHCGHTTQIHLGQCRAYRCACPAFTTTQGDKKS